jgi:hypothetical protein
VKIHVGVRKWRLEKQFNKFANWRIDNALAENAITLIATSPNQFMQNPLFAQLIKESKKQSPSSSPPQMLTQLYSR